MTPHAPNFKTYTWWEGGGYIISINKQLLTTMQGDKRTSTTQGEERTLVMQGKE
jgi:hypothetical protein